MSTENRLLYRMIPVMLASSFASPVFCAQLLRDAASSAYAYVAGAGDSVPQPSFLTDTSRSRKKLDGAFERPDFSTKHLGIDFEKEKPAEVIKRLSVLEKSALTSDDLCQLGVAYRNSGDIRKAKDILRELSTSDPENPHILLEYGNALLLDNDTAAAAALFNLAREKDKNLFEAHHNYGYALRKMNKLEEAAQAYEHLRKILSATGQSGTFNRSLADFSHATTLLALGQFKEGFRRYEARWDANDAAPECSKKPFWNGSDDLKGKKVIVRAEQGLGDTFQFVRCAQDLKKLGATVIFKTQNPLKDLMAGCSFLDQVVRAKEADPEHDMQVSLMSLPGLLKYEKDESVPAEPYLQADEKLVKEWHARLASDTGKLKIGIFWQAAGYSDPLMRLHAQARSLPSDKIAAFVDKLAKMGISVYSLQQLQPGEQVPTRNLKSFGKDFDGKSGPFMDTAAVMKNFDLVVGNDTGTLHLAGGLGAKTIALLPHHADWRWKVGCTDTPWYPTMSLARQAKPGDWDSALKEVEKQIDAMLKEKASGASGAGAASK